MTTLSGMLSLSIGATRETARSPATWIARNMNSHDTPPAITHLEYFYGFIGVVVAWQLVFLLIGRDPERYRPLMLPAVLEKLAFGVPVIILFAQGQLPGSVLFFGLLDLTLCALFLVAWRGTSDASQTVPALRTRQAGA